MNIAFLDVGHGDSIVITMTDIKGIKRAIVIDSGNFLKTKRYIIDNEINVIEYIVITHFHTDHYRGINALIDSLLKNSIKIKNICWEKDKVVRNSDDQKTYKLFTTKLLDNHMKRDISCVSKRFDNNDEKKLEIEDVEDVNVSIIYPNNYAANMFNDTNINNTSTVLRIVYKNTIVILPGDLESEGWSILSNYLKNLKCDILKMPHHGDYFDLKADGLSSDEIINKTDPSFAVISTGEHNKYNHPDTRTIEALRKSNIVVLCTQVTSLCENDRMGKRECKLKQLHISETEYNKDWCPCTGDIVFQIEDDIKLIPYTADQIKVHKELFNMPKCIEKN